MAKLATCPDCGAKISTSAAMCPRCGRPFLGGRKKAGGGLKGCVGKPLLIAVALFVVAGIFASRDARRPDAPAPAPAPAAADRKSTRLNSSHAIPSRMPSSA